MADFRTQDEHRLVVPDKTQPAYPVVGGSKYERLQDDHICRELQIAFDQADHGEWKDLDIEAVIANARQRHIET